MEHKNKPGKNILERFSKSITLFTGSTKAFFIASMVILAWIITGPIFNFSDTWQLVINTGTTIVTFLMVFLIQRAQNKESLSMQLKLNELVAAVNGASNNLMMLKVSEQELILHHYRRYGNGKELEIYRNHTQWKKLTEGTN
jgi:low affinity Fe/Cu permease